MKNKKPISIIFLIFLLNFIVINTAAAISFYDGNVIIKSFKADVNIENNANVILNYTLSGNEVVNLNFDSVPDSAVIKINNRTYGRSFDLNVEGDVSVAVAYNVGVGGGVQKQFALNPNVLFNNMANPNRIDNYLVRIKMPSGVNELLSSSEKASRIEQENGRNVYVWEKTNAYASSLSINWHELDIKLELERIIPNEITDEFTVKNIIRNNGGSVSNVKLIQTFLETDFDPVSPLGEFERIQAGNDRRLEWKKEISGIPSGSVQEFSYTLKLLNRGENVVFRPLMLYVGDTAVKIVDRVEFTTAGVDPSQNLGLSDEEIAKKQLDALSGEQTVAEVEKAPPAISDNELSTKAPEDGTVPTTAQEEEIKEEKSSQQEKPSKPGEPAKKKVILYWTAAIILILLLAIAVLFFLARKKGEVRY